MNRTELVETIKKALPEIKKECFVESAQATVTDVEVVALVLSSLFQWDAADILRTAAYALEDSNYHRDCEKLLEMAEEQ